MSLEALVLHTDHENAVLAWEQNPDYVREELSYVIGKRALIQNNYEAYLSEDVVRHWVDQVKLFVDDPAGECDFSIPLQVDNPAGYTVHDVFTSDAGLPPIDLNDQANWGSQFLLLPSGNALRRTVNVYGLETENPALVGKVHSVDYRGYSVEQMKHLDDETFIELSQ